MSANPTQPAPTYELKSDVTGEAPVRRGATVLKDGRGNELPVPFPPKPKCNKCYGRGFVGVDVKRGGLIPCHRCYPPTKGE